MRSIVLGVVLAAGALASTPAAQGGVACPIGGIVTSSFGTGCGFLSPSILDITFDTSTCTLTETVTATGCCNTFPVSQLLLIGTALPLGIPLPTPTFYSSCELLVDPAARIPISGLSRDFGPLISPDLVGVTVDFQSVVFFFTTIGLTFDLGATDGVSVTFL